MRTKRDRTKAVSIAKKAAATTRKAQQIAIAAGPVIAARAAMGAGAMSRPSVEAALEYNRMIAEKVTALSMCGFEAAKSTTEMALRAASFASAEAVKLGGRGAKNRSPVGFYNRLLSHNLAMGSLAFSAFNAALTPFHGTVRANAKRLKRSRTR